MIMTTVRFHDNIDTAVIKPVYSVIVARYRDAWIFVRHRDRSTWEICGGHVEEGESAGGAARRELMEETGAIDFEEELVSVYSVEKNGEIGYGALFFAEVYNMGNVTDTSEIEAVLLSDRLPLHLTYPDIQPLLFRRVAGFVTKKE
jgi:8-oxo-dGTP diphosphatase